MATTPSVSTPFQFKTDSEASSYRLKAIIERLTFMMNSKSARFDTAEFFTLCFALARGVDYALTINDVPSISHRLPSLLKQVHHSRNEGALRPAIMVLMISAKNASKNGWFLAADAQDVVDMTTELFSNFCTTVSHGIDSAQSIVGTLVSRFYPQLTVDSLICSFEAKPGYDILMSDFEIPKNYPSEDNIMLIVVQTDNMDTSSCIISPSQASVMINGKGVDGRTIVSPGSGPQFPSDVSKMLKYGTNIIQAVGTFTGNYLLVLAFMRKVHLRDPPILSEYVRTVSEVAGADSEIIEGASRISLNCPISFRRIKTPVKGHLCKHHQCFDYDNYITMNLKKPSWRCPSCNQPVCFIDLRTDPYMVKIIKEVDEKINDVEISSDGSWTAISNKNSVENESKKGGQYNETATETVDLTSVEENGMLQSGNHACDIEDRKPLKNPFDTCKQILPSNLQPPDAQQHPVTSARFNPIATYYNSMRALDNNNGGQPVVEVTPLAESRQPPSQFWNSVTNPRYVNRPPTAVQAVEAPAQHTGPNKRMRLNGQSPVLESSMAQMMERQPVRPCTLNAAMESQNQQGLSRLRSLIASSAHNRTNPSLYVDASRELVRQIAQRNSLIQTGASPPINLQPQASRTSNVEPPSLHIPDLPVQPAGNWRPTGRMRGSLTGNAYSAAVNKYGNAAAAGAASGSQSKQAQGSSVDMAHSSAVHSLDMHIPRLDSPTQDMRPRRSVQPPARLLD